RVRALALVAVAVLWAAPGAAVAERGLLWRVTQQGVAPSFVFGTIHLEDPRVLRVPAIV
ncbi:MAG: TraB/GumN family protein, partial [Gammaproteobacteria bacterium]|nr:TraB/GumN family protein [Gammaproteobacteria bacterium]NIV77011.1 TraB/GumN family protein [Gammaproteobacteria bacterium]